MKISDGSDNMLILGSGGKVGRMLARHWAAHPPEGCTPVFQSRRGRMAAPAGIQTLRWAPGDDPRSLPRAHVLVALWGVTPGSDQPMSMNATLARLALEIARKRRIGRVILASSSAVYTGQGAGRHREREDLNEPPGAYGRAKLEMERTAMRWSAENGAPPGVSVLRLANVIGADGLFAALGRKGAIKLDRFASGQGPKRSYLSVGDLARVLQKLALLPAKNLPPLLNVAGERPISMQALVEAAGRPIEWHDAPPDALEQIELDTSLLASIAGPLDESADPARAIAAWKLLRDTT